MYNLTGTLKVKNDTQVISEKFQKREFVVTDNSSQYPQDIQLQLTQEHVSKIDALNVGDTVTVGFFLRGREWTSPKDGQVRYFNSLDAWKVEPANNTNEPVSTPQPMTSNEGDDDLPF